MKLTRKNSKEELLWAAESQNRRIRELEAELQSRDHMLSYIMGTLVDATGRRGFHNEMEAADCAAKMLADARLDSARLDHVLAHTDGDYELGGASAEGYWDDVEAEHIGDEREHLRAWRRAIDAAMKEAK